MLLYLVQHGESKKEEEDTARGLTDKGIQDIRTIGGFAQKLTIAVGQIYHSGKTRAEQTAHAVAGFVTTEKGVTSADGLAPMDDPGIWVERLQKMNDDIMLVGHLPHLSKLAAALLCGDPGRGIVNFRNSGIVTLSKNEEGRWVVEWIIVPSIIP